MRAIFNIHSNQLAKIFGWRAREIYVHGKREATLFEVLEATTMACGGTLYSYIIEDGLIKNEWQLYVNGNIISGPSCLKTILKDSTQIHLIDNPKLRTTGRPHQQNSTM